MNTVFRTTILFACIIVFAGCASFQKSSKDRDAILKMKAEIIHEADFREAHIWDVVEFYNVGHLDDGEPVDAATQIVLVLPTPDRKKIPQITFQAHQLSLYESIKTMAKLTGLTFIIRDGRPWLIYEE